MNYRPNGLWLATASGLAQQSLDSGAQQGRHLIARHVSGGKAPPIIDPSPARDGTLFRGCGSLRHRVHVVLAQHRRELFPVTAPLVMLSLILNVRDGRVGVRNAHAECGVSFLPRKPAPGFANPPR